MYWHRISELLMDWHFGQGLVDWNRIGRVALIRQIGDGLTSNR